MKEIDYVPFVKGLSDVIVTYRPIFFDTSPYFGGHLLFWFSVQRSAILVKKDSGSKGIRIIVHPPS